MKKLKALVNGIPVTLEVAENLHEFSEGFRGLPNALDNTGILFNFNKVQHLVFENGGVQEPITLLFLANFKTYGTVDEVAYLLPNDTTHRKSIGTYPIAIELKSSFCEKNKIGVGAFVTLYRN